MDIDTQIFILEAEQEIAEVELIEKEQLARNPDWWNIAIGLVDAPRDVYDKAKEIKREFSQFNPIGAKDTYHRFELFQQAKIQGKI